MIDEFEMLEEAILTPMHAFLDILDTISVDEFKCAPHLPYFPRHLTFIADSA